MSISKRNLLCVKKFESLELGHQLLYKPYKNIIMNLRELSLDIEAKDFDPVAKIFDGLLSIPLEKRHFYESLLGVTSYYHHSQGGRGKYIEKKIASFADFCSLNIELSNIPFWLENPLIHKKKGIFTLDGLTSDEKSIMRKNQWDWIGNRKVTTDIGNILKDEKTIVLLEIKNRIDTGGTAARREIWTSEKFGIYLDYLITDEKLFRKFKQEFSLTELLKFFNIEKLEIYLGVLFDKSDSPANISIDKVSGFYSSSKQGFEFLCNKLSNSPSIKIISKDSESLNLKFELVNSEITVEVGALYGNDITMKLFRKPLPLTDLLLLKYDDIWLAQLITIDERSILLKYKKNFSTIFIDLLSRDSNLRNLYDGLIISEINEKELNNIIRYLFDKYDILFDDSMLPLGKDKSEYLADIIQVLCLSDA